MKTKNELENIGLQEAGLSRIWKQTMEYDIALISTCRTKCINCIYPQKDKEDGGKYTSSENRKRTKLLRAKLLSHKFGVTAVDGTYIEHKGTPFAKHLDEDSFFVVNLKNDPNFKDKLIELEKEFCQDSVILHAKDDEEFYEYGTNHGTRVGLDKTLSAGKKFVAGIEKEFMSKIRNRPFAFTNEIKLQINSKNPNSPRIEKLFENINVYKELDGLLHHDISGIRTVLHYAKENVCCKD